MSALVFLDTETTGLDPARDELWEFAAIRREEGGGESRHHWFVEHDDASRDRMPERFRADLEARYDRKLALTRANFATFLADAIFRDRPRIVGAAPWFDAGFLATFVSPSRWSHRLIDVETLAAGKAGRLMNGLADAASMFGIDNPAAHTAMADAETAMRIYDAVMGGEPA